MAGRLRLPGLADPDVDDEGELMGLRRTTLRPLNDVPF